MKSSPGRLIALLLVSAAPVAAQANTIPGLDIRLSNMRELAVMGRTGTYPAGLNGISFETTVCNEGTVDVPWFAPMNPNHPLISFLVASVRDDRIVQLSNRPYVKHGFFAVNGNGCSATCMRPGGTLGEYLGVGCSDTYATFNNGDSYYLGPPDEVDPWLGTWTRRCSLFDRGFPDVGSPANCDGRRSLTHDGGGRLGPVETRVQVSDADLILGGTLCYQANYLVEGMAESVRGNSLGSRTFRASWTGTRWNLVPTSGLFPGSVLSRWPDAFLRSSVEGDIDGRVYVAVKVTGPDEGFYHYEYALHNRDHATGIGTVRIPICFAARVRGFGFRDFDQDPSNDWVGVKTNAIEFSSATSPLLWNTITNLWFDSDAAPAEIDLALTAFGAGSARPSFAVNTLAPVGLYNVWLGPGCARDTPPTLFATGTPARAELGNATFALASAGNDPFQLNMLLHGASSGSRPLLGCTLWTGAGPAFLASIVTSDANGVATHAGPIPNDVSLEGRAFRFQAVGRVPGGGRLFTNFELSDGLLVRVGNQIAGCP